jgi:hypothetical protein
MKGVSFKVIVTALAIFMAFAVSPAFSQTTTDTKNTTDAKAGTATSNAELAKNTDQQPSDLGGWRVTDFQPYTKALADLEKLSDEYSENILKMAIDEYSTGLDILEDMQFEVKKLKDTFAKKNNLNERWYWQEIDRKSQEARQVGMLKVEAKTKSITYFTRAINHLDEIQSIKIKSDTAFTNAQIRLFQIYVSTQYDIGNLLPCIPLLERYVAINETTKKDIWAYNYMASCYGYMETMVSKSHIVGEDERQKYKSKKNSALLTACELKYGVETVQYKHLKEVVELDEKKSASINDFK